MQPDEAYWREPGQAVSADYLKNGALRYAAEGREIVGRNLSCFNNRPLYCQPQDTGFVLTGDRPLVRLIGGFQAGVWIGAIVRDGAGKWFHECAEVESRYRCGRMAWRVSDPAVPGAEAELEVVPLNGAAGFALRLKARGLRAGDRLIWSFGGLQSQDAGPRHSWGSTGRGAWDPVMWGNPNIHKTGDPRKPLTRLGFIPDACVGNQVRIDGQSFTVLMSPGAPQMTVGTVDHAVSLRAADASAFADPAKLAASNADQQPLVCGVIDLRDGEEEVLWVVDHCVEYIHPEHGPVSRHGLTDVDWAAIATGTASDDQIAILWPQLRDNPDFIYSGIPGGIATKPETYEDWEMQHIDRHDLAAMGRGWFLECWARARMGDRAGILRSLRQVAEVGKANNWSWMERYYSEKTGDLGQYHFQYYCEYPANFIRIVHRFLADALGHNHARE